MSKRGGRPRDLDQNRPRFLCSGRALPNNRQSHLATKRHDYQHPIHAVADPPDQLSGGNTGHGTFLHTLYDGRKILIANIMGQMVIQPTLEDPFAAAEKLVAQHRLGATVQAIFVDFHAEVTSEKVAMGHFLDGRVSAVIGTHTHIPTADDHLLPRKAPPSNRRGHVRRFRQCYRHEKKSWPCGVLLKKCRANASSPAEGEATLCGTL